ncbi:MAG TPA: alpha/beta hydrolase [Methylomirabilota bacterium]|nr:alpha/beta hydrolase [Methylomirabilota bacterium]
MASLVQERIGDLLLDRVPARPPARRHPLLLVHGMNGGSWYLRSYLEAAAAAGWDAWAVNLRGHWGSRPVADLGRVSVLDYVQDVRDCLAVLGPSVVIGHSMGGLVAQKIAEEGLARAAVFVTSAAPRGIVILSWPVVRRMWRHAGMLFRNRPFTPTPEDAEALIANALPRERARQLYPKLVPESGRAARELAFGAIAVDARRVRCSTLVVGAERDVITPASVQRRIAAKYAATYIEAAGHAHMLMLEDGWERPFDAILTWLERAVGR